MKKKYEKESGRRWRKKYDEEEREERKDRGGWSYLGGEKNKDIDERRNKKKSDREKTEVTMKTLRIKKKRKKRWAMKVFRKGK